MSELIDDGHRRRDLRQQATALRRGWIIPEQADEFVPKRMLQIVAKGKEREAIAAALVLAEMKKQNERHERTEQQATPSVAIQINNGGTVATSEAGRGRFTSLVERLRIQGTTATDSE